MFGLHWSRRRSLYSLIHKQVQTARKCRGGFMRCQSDQQAMPLRYWLADWAHHQPPMLVFWTLLLPHSQLSNQMFGWFPSRVSLIHRNQDFTLLQRKLWQGEHEDLIEDSHQAAGHCRSFLVPQLALVALHTDPGIQGCTTQGSQIRNCRLYCMCKAYFYEGVCCLPESEHIFVRTVLIFSSPTSSLWEVGRNFKDRSTSPTRSCRESERINTSTQYTFEYNIKIWWHCCRPINNSNQQGKQTNIWNNRHNVKELSATVYLWFSPL